MGSLFMRALPHRRVMSAALACALLALSGSAPRTAAALARAASTGSGPNQYTIVAGRGSFTPLPDSALINGGLVDDETYGITLPFSYRLYNTTYPAGTTVQVSTNGNIQFDGDSPSYDTPPLPDGDFGDAILGLQADLVSGVYVRTSGTAPHRVLNVEYRGGYYSNPDVAVDIEIRLFEDSATRYFDVTYNALAGAGKPGVAGVQEGTGGSYTQYEANTAGSIRPGTRLTFYDSADPPPPALRLLDATVRTAAVGRAPTALAVDALTGRAFVANGAEGSLSMVDTHDGTLLHTVTVGRDPVAVAADQKRGRVFVANALDDSVSVLDAVSGQLVRTISVGAGPDAVAVDGATGRVFVANRDDNSVSVLDAASGTVLASVPTVDAPRTLAVDATTGRVFVAGAADALAMLDAVSGRVLGLVRLMGHPLALAVDAASGHVAVASGAPDGGSRLSLLDGRGTVLHTMWLRGGIAALTVAGQTGVIVVVGMDGRVRLLDAGDGSVRKTIDVAGTGTALGAAVDEQRGHILVAAPGTTDAAHRFSSAGTLYVLDARDGSLVGYTGIGHSPLALSVDGGAARALILDNADNTLTVLDTTRLARPEPQQ